jgi:hypothetical protein
LRLREILRHTSGSDVAVIAIFKASPRIKGVNPALKVADHERSRDACNQVRPNAKITRSPKRSAGNEVLNF